MFHLVLGFSLAEVAEKMGVPEGTVKSGYTERGPLSVRLANDDARGMT